MNDVDTSRARKLADLIRDARLHADRSPEQCARTLGVSDEVYAQIEAAERGVSLPELEVLALYLKVHMSYFWGSEALGDSSPPDYALYLSLRQRIIGALIRQARLETGLDPEDLAEALAVNAERIAAYETGSEPVPYIELEKLAQYLDLPVSRFTDEQVGPLAKNEVEVQTQKRLAELPPDVKAFVVEPINLSYLETAMRLSEMDVKKLRNIAEGILEITL